MAEKPKVPDELPKPNDDKRPRNKANMDAPAEEFIAASPSHPKEEEEQEDLPPKE